MALTHLIKRMFANNASEGSIVRKLSRAERDRAIIDLQKGYEDVIDLIQVMKEHMNQQSAFNDQMAGMLTKLPQAVEALPESARQQSRIADTLHVHSEQSQQNEEKLIAVLNQMAVSSGNTEKILNQLQSQQNNQEKIDSQMLKSFHAFNASLEQMNQANQTNTQILQYLIEQQERREEQVNKSLSSSASRSRLNMAAAWLIFFGAAAMFGFLYYDKVSLPNNTAVAPATETPMIHVTNQAPTLNSQPVSEDALPIGEDVDELEADKTAIESPASTDAPVIDETPIPIDESISELKDLPAENFIPPGSTPEPNWGVLIDD